MVECRCECGEILDASIAQLLKGKIKSCGCLVADSTRSMGQSQRYSFGLSSYNGLIARYKKQANSRGLNFELTNDQFLELTQGKCHYCGTGPSQIHRRGGGYGHFVYNGIDRVENSVGYVLSNCVSCCGTCNSAKAALNYSSFMAWVDRLSTHHANRISHAV